MKTFNYIDNIPSRNEIKGSFGERLSKVVLKFFGESFLIHDVLINTENGNTSQIDLVVINDFGVFVIEVKNYNSNSKIYGDGTKREWYYYLGGKKYNFYNPLMQNKKHIEYLKKICANFSDIPFYSVVLIFCEDFKVKNINNMNGINTVLCNSIPSLFKAFGILEKQSMKLISREEQIFIYEYIKTQQVEGKEARIEHVKSVKNYKDILDKENDKKICPFCKTELVLRNGKYGAFYGCTNYPNCKYTLKINKK